MQIIDAVGKNCPEPVIMTKKALENLPGENLSIILDNPISRDNVERFAKSKNCDVKTEEKDNVFYVHIYRKEVCEIMEFEEERKTRPLENSTVIYVASDQVGIGSEELGHMLMRAFIKTIKELEEKPKKIIFINSGVKLTSGDSKVIDDLKVLEGQNIEIMSCGTCLDFYGLKEQLHIGSISNMFEILSSLSQASKVIRP